MRDKFQKIMAFVSLGVAFGLGLLVTWDSGAMAADCKALGEAISKERTLLTKKSMIEEAMQACPRDVDIAYQHGYTLERLRKYEDALKSYKNAINLDAGYAKAYFSIGDIQMILKNYTEAAEAFEAGLRLDPGDDRARSSLKDAEIRYKELTGKSLPTSLPVVAGKPAAVPGPDGPAVGAAGSKVSPVAKAGDSLPPQLVAPILRLQVPFSEQSSDLSQDAKDILAVVVGQAMQRNDMAQSRFEISGHTDNLGDQANNLEISKKRAEAVQQYLTENFKIADQRLPVAYYGQNRPTVPNTSPANRELNRRVEFSSIQ